MRERTGQIYENKKNGLWAARVCYKNANGKRTAIQRTAESKSGARKILKQLLEKLEGGGRERVDAEKLTFNDVADYYERHYAKPAKFIDDRKVEGLRDLGRIRGFIKQFRLYFGEKKLCQITYGDVFSFRNERLKIPTHYKRVRNNRNDEQGTILSKKNFQYRYSSRMDFKKSSKYGRAFNRYFS